MKQILLLASMALISFTLANAQCSKSQKPCCTKKSSLQFGGRNSNITHRESTAIARQNQDVRFAIRVAMSDGYISPEERRIIRNEKAQVTNTVYRAQNNNRTRY